MAYMSQEKKAKIAAELKTIIPKSWKWSLSVRHHSTLVLTIASAPVDLMGMLNEYWKARHSAPWCGRVSTEPFEPRTYADVYGDALREGFTGEAAEIMKNVLVALYRGNHDRSDIQTDYFDVGWYVSTYIGKWDKPFVCTGESMKVAA